MQIIEKRIEELIDYDKARNAYVNRLKYTPSLCGETRIFPYLHQKRTSGTCRYF